MTPTPYSHRLRADNDMIYQLTYVNYLEDAKNAKGQPAYQTVNAESSRSGHINLDNKYDHALKQTRKLLDSLKVKNVTFLCVQDKIDHNEPGAEEVTNYIREQFYDKVYPNPSPFELKYGH